MSKGLKALKKIEKEMSRLCGMDIAYDGKVFNLFSIVGKELKVLEIIKNKEVQIATLILSNSCDGYNFSKGLLGKFLTQEEYDLLKEVLL